MKSLIILLAFVVGVSGRKVFRHGSKLSVKTDGEVLETISKLCQAKKSSTRFAGWNSVTQKLNPAPVLKEGESICSVPNIEIRLQEATGRSNAFVKECFNVIFKDRNVPSTDSQEEGDNNKRNKLVKELSGDTAHDSVRNLAKAVKKLCIDEQQAAQTPAQAEQVLGAEALAKITEDCQTHNSRTRIKSISREDGSRVYMKILKEGESICDLGSWKVIRSRLVELDATVKCFNYIFEEIGVPRTDKEPAENGDNNKRNNLVKELSGDTAHDSVNNLAKAVFKLCGKLAPVQEVQNDSALDKITKDLREQTSTSKIKSFNKDKTGYIYHQVLEKDQTICDVAGSVERIESRIMDAARGSNAFVEKCFNYIFEEREVPRTDKKPAEDGDNTKRNNLVKELSGDTAHDSAKNLAKAIFKLCSEL